MKCTWHMKKSKQSHISFLMLVNNWPALSACRPEVGLTGVFPWCVIDWFLSSVKREFNKLFFVIRDLKVLRDPWRTWIITDIRDFTTLFGVILRRQCSGRLGLKTSNVTSNRLRLIFVIIHFANSRALHACHGSHVYSYGFLCLGKSKDSDPKHRNIRDMEGTSTSSTMRVECIIFYNNNNNNNNWIFYWQEN